MECACADALASVDDNKDIAGKQRLVKTSQHVPAIRDKAWLDRAAVW